MKEATATRVQMLKDFWALEDRVFRAAYEFRRIQGQRRGQALMNGLRIQAPELYEILTGSPNDCFYDDSKVAGALSELGFTRREF